MKAVLVRRQIIQVVLMLGTVIGCFATETHTVWKHYRGMCDASAMEMLNDDLFVAADDEDNALNIYSRSKPGNPVQTLSLDAFSGRKKKRAPEIDFEGAARIDDYIYLISSHGANSSGKFQPGRHRFFAVQVRTNNGVPYLAPVGTIYSSLLRDLAETPDLAEFNLRRAGMKAPKAENALNIEGLAPTKEGHLLIGFRNPIPEGKALLVPLLNPKEVTLGQRAKLGKHLLLDLDGMGIRSITAYKTGYLIVAGSFESGGVSHLYEWSGGASQPARLTTTRGLPANPEAISVIDQAESKTLFALSDDGAVMIGNAECKKLKDKSLKVFRAFEIPL